MKSNRDEALEGLRGLAVLAVIFCHISELCIHYDLWESKFWAGACGAHLLLVICGYSMAAMLAQPSSNAISFARKRLLKVYPSYALAIVISGALIILFHPPLYSISISQLLANLTMCQSWLGLPDIDGAYWLTAVLLKFNVLVAVAIAFQLSGKRGEWFAYGYLALILALRLAPTYGVELPGSMGRSFNIQHAHLFIAGMMLWHMQHCGNTSLRTAAFATCVGIESLGASIPWGSFVIVLLMIVVLIRHDLRIFSVKPLVAVGRCSHMIYMLHGVICYVVMKYALMAGSTVTVAILASYVVVLATSHYLTKCLTSSTQELVMANGGGDTAITETGNSAELELQTLTRLNEINEFSRASPDVSSEESALHVHHGSR